MWERATIIPSLAIAAALTLGACGGGDETVGKPVAKQSQQEQAAPTQTKKQRTPEPKPTPTMLKVPTDLAGQTLGSAKERLTKLGFTHIVIAGGEVTDADPVASVPKAGETVAADAKLVVVGDAPKPQPVAPDTSESGTGSSESDGTTGTDTSERTPPKYGYQCRPGDEDRYDVCAGHKAWVDGQREFAACKNSGGTWDIPSQSCVRKND